jgi:hypothetical protein
VRNQRFVIEISSLIRSSALLVRQVPQGQCVKKGKPCEPEATGAKHFFRLIRQVSPGIVPGLRIFAAAIGCVFEPLRQRNLDGET